MMLSTSELIAKPPIMEAGLPLPYPLGHVLQRHDTLAHSRYPGHHRGASSLISTVYHLIETGDSRRHPLRMEQLSLLFSLRSRRLNAAVHLEALAIDDPQGVAAHLKLLAP